MKKRITAGVTALLMSVSIIINSVGVHAVEMPAASAFETCPSEVSSVDMKTAETNENEKLDGDDGEEVPNESEDTTEPGLPNNPSSDEMIAVTDLDIADVQTPMPAGTSQVLSVSVIPANATDSAISYISLTPEIATVNAIGRVRGLREGTAQIQVSAGEVSRIINIAIVPKEEYVPVKEIEVIDYNDAMAVNKTQIIRVNVYPANATNQSINYSSSNTSVATISPSGEIIAKSAGIATIELSSVDIVKTLVLTVYIPTDNIKVEDNYVILRPGQQHQIESSIIPASAAQHITYKSTNDSVATVDSSGRIHAVSIGRASILLANKDSMTAVTVIVNQGIRPANNNTPEADTLDEHPPSEDLNSIIAGATEFNSCFTVTIADCPTITESILLALYKSEKTLRVTAGTYDLQVSGTNLKNAKNEIKTELHLKEVPDGLEFSINEGGDLPGEITIHIPLLDSAYRYLYLYNEATKIYQRVNGMDGKILTINTSGRYLLTIERLKQDYLPLYFFLAAGTAASGCVIAYIATKRRYWFW